MSDSIGDTNEVRQAHQGFVHITTHTIEFLFDHVDELGLSGIAVYVLLTRYAGFVTKQTMVKNSTLCLRLQMHRASLYRHFKVLQKLNLIRRLPKSGGGFVITIFAAPGRYRRKDLSFPLFDGKEAANLGCRTSATLSHPCDEVVATTRQDRRTSATRNKEEQDTPLQDTPSQETREGQNLPLIAEDEVPEPVEKDGQTQHALVRERIQKLYKGANPETPCPWDGRTGKILKDTLDRLRWPDAALLTAVENRFASDVALSEDPQRWIPQLDRYRAGPLDRFNKPVNGGKKENASDRLKTRLERELEISARLNRKQTG